MKRPKPIRTLYISDESQEGLDRMWVDPIDVYNFVRPYLTPEQAREVMGRLSGLRSEAKGEVKGRKKKLIPFNFPL